MTTPRQILYKGQRYVLATVPKTADEEIPKLPEEKGVDLPFWQKFLGAIYTAFENSKFNHDLSNRLWGTSPLDFYDFAHAKSSQVRDLVAGGRLYGVDPTSGTAVEGRATFLDKMKKLDKFLRTAFAKHNADNLDKWIWDRNEASQNKSKILKALSFTKANAAKAQKSLPKLTAWVKALDAHYKGKAESSAKDALAVLKKMAPPGFKVKRMDGFDGYTNTAIGFIRGTKGKDEIQIVINLDSMSGHTSFDTKNGRMTFDAHGVDDSFYPDLSKPEELKTMILEQVERAEKSQARHGSAVKIPGLGGHTVTKAEKELVKNKLNERGIYTFSPSGFGTAYMLTTKPQQHGDSKIRPDLAKFFGVKTVYLTTEERD